MQQGEYLAELQQGSGPGTTRMYRDWPSLMTHWDEIDSNEAVRPNPSVVRQPSQPARSNGPVADPNSN